MYTLLGSDNQQYGPVSEEDVRQWIQAGRANGQTLVYKQSAAEWAALSTFPEFAGLLHGPGTSRQVGQATRHPQHRPGHAVLMALLTFELWL